MVPIFLDIKITPIGTVKTGPVENFFQYGFSVKKTYFVNVDLFLVSVVELISGLRLTID